MLDSGEAGVAGRTVFLNIDGTGAPDASNPSAMTDSSGNYYFVGLPAGNYSVTEVTPSDATAATAPQTVTVAAGQSASGIDFAEQGGANAEGTATISGTVFNDVNLNGRFDAGEPGLAGRIVFVDVDGSGQADGTNPQTTTDANGEFSFMGLAAGDAAVMEAISADHGVTLTTTVQTLSIAAAQNVSGVDIGNALTSTILPMQISTDGPLAAADPNTAYINAVFQSILGHAPDATGLAYWQQQMAAGQPRSAVAQGVWDSTEHRGDEVEEFYHEFLGRVSDPVGKAYWIAAYGDWGTEQIEAAGFLTSVEYMNLHPGHTNFVDALYNDVDLRPADLAGESYWTNQLDGGEDPVQVAFAFIYGQEASTAVVDAFYSGFLHRLPGADLQMWVDDLTQRTLTAEQVGVQILAGDEYFSNVSANSAPSIISAASASFTEGAAGSFLVSTTGTPAAAITETGALPGGMTFVDNGDGTATIGGTPATGSAGRYSLTITAANGASPDATQTLTLTVNAAVAAPAITNSDSASFTEDSAASFAISTTGSPTAAISESGALPSGVTFVDNGDGTATLAGTPAIGAAGTYSLTIIASNGVSPDATQTLTLTVSAATLAAPAITSTDAATFSEGSAASFTVSTTGVPTTAISESGTLPSGMTFIDNGDGTATIAGTPDAGTSATYPITITASNGLSPDATQTFTLTVNPEPQADLSIAATDDSSTPGSVVPGASLTYTITVANAGPGDVTGASVADTLPAGFTGASFTATSTGGAVGFTASGAGDISDTVDMPAGSTITYVVTGTVDPSAAGTLSNTATVAAPAGVTDADLTNNSATDDDTVTP